MYPDYLQDRKNLGYFLMKDKNCGTVLVLRVDSSVLKLKSISKIIVRNIKVLIILAKINVQIIIVEIWNSSTSGCQKLRL
jgi:hypothetical protein